MKTLATLVVQIAVVSILLPAISGCSANAEAHNDVATANARVTAADAVARVDALANPRKENKSRGKAKIPSGAVLKVFLIDAIDSDTGSRDDRFLASLAESVIVSGVTLLPKGTRLRGRVIHADAVIHLELIDIVRGNRPVTIRTRVYKAKENHYNPETRLDFTLMSPVDL